MTPEERVMALCDKLERLHQDHVGVGSNVWDAYLDAIREAIAAAYEDAINAINAEVFHVATQDQVDVLVVAKARFIAAIAKAQGNQ